MEGPGMDGVLLLLIAPALYLLWRSMQSGDSLSLSATAPGPRVTGRLKQMLPDRGLVIEITNNDRANRITQISVARSTASELGLSEPSGFHPEPLPLTEFDKRSMEMTEFVNTYNLENLRWVGNFHLPPETSIEMTIPAARGTLLAGTIDFQYEAKVGLGGSISFFHVDLVTPRTAPATAPGNFQTSPELRFQHMP